MKAKAKVRARPKAKAKAKVGAKPKAKEKAKEESYEDLLTSALVHLEEAARAASDPADSRALMQAHCIAMEIACTAMGWSEDEDDE